MPLLDVQNLSLTIPTIDGDIHAVRNVSFPVREAEFFGIVGESGSGKSVLSQAIMRLLPNIRASGRIVFDGEDLLTLPEMRMRALRGNRIAMISQDPLSALHPYFTIGHQIAEAIRTHRSLSRGEALHEAAELLGQVGIADPPARLADYPHQFSGGMRQRVMIAMAIALKPKLLIADEPTTALDVTIQAQIIRLIDEMRRKLGTAVIMVSHDLGLLSGIADDVMVMYAGNRMELGAGRGVLMHPRHPYTRGLLASAPTGAMPKTPLASIPGQPPSLLLNAPGCVFAPRCAIADTRCQTERPPVQSFPDGGLTLCWSTAPERLPAARPAPAGIAARGEAQASPPVRVTDLRLSYRASGFFRKAPRVEVLKGVSLELARGTTLGIVGESGCGKSTLARVIAGLALPDAGRVEIDGRDTAGFGPTDWMAMRRKVQMVFQDPFGSLNPRRRAGSIIGDPARIQKTSRGAARKASVCELMEMVGLNPEHYNRYPYEFSGGQRQRIGIARALALNPEVVIFDEPVSALDVSIQAQILNLILKLQRDLGLSYIFISHDLSVVRHVSDRIAVMLAGEIVEEGETEAVYTAPRHAYTRRLLLASRPGPAAEPARSSA